ncbi:Peroxisomal membrane protein PMP47A, partial [Neolecta irregularis DAH-3]
SRETLLHTYILGPRPNFSCPLSSVFDIVTYTTPSFFSFCYSIMSDNLVHALSGAGGGMAALALTYPLVSVSTRAQVESRRKDTSVYEAIIKILKDDGVYGLYRGMKSGLFGIGLTNGIYYFFYEWVKKLYATAALKNKRVHALSAKESIIAGAVAGSLTVLITNPIWVANTRMTARRDTMEASETLSATESAKRKARSTLDMFKDIIQKDGISALWSGIGPALILVSNPIIQYTVFEQLKIILTRKRPLTPRDAFWLGAIGKLVATGLTYPYITVKARMQMRQSSNLSERYDSLYTSITKVVDQEGVAGLYKGVQAKLLQSVVTAAFLFMFKEKLYLGARSFAQAVPRAKKI